MTVLCRQPSTVSKVYSAELYSSGFVAWACLTQAAQMQLLLRVPEGIWARKSAANLVWVHQHGNCFLPVVRSTSWVH
jgi:hypothetical protein